MKQSFRAYSVSRRIFLGTIITLMALLDWSAGAYAIAHDGNLTTVVRGGKAALIAEVEVSSGVHLIVRVPKNHFSPVAPGILLRKGGTAPTSVRCAVKRSRNAYIIRSCVGADELSGFRARIGQISRLNLDAALDPSIKGLDPGVVQKSAEGDHCRAHCHYQWQWAILACFLWNPTGGCYDQVNHFLVACSTRCPP